MLNNPLKNRRREKFAQLLARGKTATDAYEQAGYKRSDSNGPTLAKNEEITGRVAEINGQRWSQERAAAAVAIERAAVTRESLIAMAEEVCVKAKEAGQFSAAVAAIREIGVLTGFRVERRETGAPFEFADVSTADLLRELKELGYDVREGVPADGDVPPSQAVN